MRLYNFLTRKIQTFRPMDGKIARIYACGPTVYNFAHIGNLRTYVFEDVLRRTIEANGWKAKMVMNITDVDDKIIRDAKKASKSIFEFVRPYEKAFFEDLKKLNVKPADKYPRATKHIKEMIALINKLLTRGLAYESDGSIYFDISKFKKYGRLNRFRTLHVRSSSGHAVSGKSGKHRVDVDEYAKGQAEDFVLWKGAKKGEPYWPAEFNLPASSIQLPGRPGWHIECSAMSMKYLGETFDIHAGAVDLLFPHHENEIAQSMGATGKPFARFFVEGEHLLVEGKKMAKSLGNSYTLRDIEKRAFSPLAFRYLVLTSHYRSKLNFTWGSLKSAQNALEKIQNRVLELKSQEKNYKGDNKNFRYQFLKTVSDDLNAPKALALFWKNFDKLALSDILWADRILGLNLASLKPKKTPAKIQKLVKEREKFRKLALSGIERKKNWTKADEIRSEVRKLGWSLEDTPQGPAVKKL